MQQDHYEITDGLLARWLAGEANGAEDAAIQQWVDAAPENSRRVDDYRRIWLESQQFNTASQPNADEAWARFQGRVAASPAARRRIRLMPGRKASWSLAAGLLLLIGLGGISWYVLEVRPNEMLSVHAWDQPKKARLADGSVITLNKGATLWHPRAFRGDARRVLLSGEGFFEVTPDKAHPFIITAGDADIRVVGTSFNVKSQEARTEVIVETGVVSVRGRRDSVLLHPQEQASLATNGTLKKSNTADQLHNYYRTREFICNGTTLKRLAAVLGEAYGKSIRIADERTAALTITTTFRNESLDAILGVIAETLSVRVVREGDGYVIR